MDCAKPNKLNICIAVKERSLISHNGTIRTPLPNCINSIAESSSKIAISCIIADFGSSDWPISFWISQYVKSFAKFEQLAISEPFSRGYGLNRAAENARDCPTFFLDADMIVTEKLLHRAVEVANDDAILYPVCQAQLEDGRIGHWMEQGCGNVVIPYNIWKQVAPWSEFHSWGGEDWVMRSKLGGRRIVQERFPGFIHQWHPAELRSKYYSRPDGADYSEFLGGDK